MLATGFLSQIASRCRWAARYHFEPLQQCAWLAGFGGDSNVRRLGPPHRFWGRKQVIVFVTVVCSAEDRSGISLNELASAAKAKFNGPNRAKRAGYDWPEPEDSSPHHVDWVGDSSPRHEDRAVLTIRNILRHLLTVEAAASSGGEQIDDFLDRRIGTMVGSFETAVGSVLGIGLMVKTGCWREGRITARERRGTGERPRRLWW